MAVLPHKILLGPSLSGRAPEAPCVVRDTETPVRVDCRKDCECDTTYQIVGYPVQFRHEAWAPALDWSRQHIFCYGAARALLGTHCVICEQEDGPRLENTPRYAAIIHRCMCCIDDVLLFGPVLGPYAEILAMVLPVSLEYYRRAALERQNQHRRELLGPVVQLAAMWGLGRDVVHLVLDLAVPRLRR